LLVSSCAVFGALGCTGCSKSRVCASGWWGPEWVVGSKWALESDLAEERNSQPAFYFLGSFAIFPYWSSISSVNQYIIVILAYKSRICYMYQVDSMYNYSIQLDFI
jgi:hypothetical protein